MAALEFRPSRLLPGAHAQTIAQSLVPGPRVPGRARILDVPVAEGTSIRLLISEPAQPPRGTLLLVHGLSGSADSGYMKRTAASALARGWLVARMNLRNCGGTEALARTLYNAGQSDDAGAALAALERERSPRPFALLGFSLGGNIGLRYAGLSSPGCLADAVVGINPPVDLGRCIEAMERRGNALYHLYFTLGLCSHLRRIRRVRPVPGPPATFRAVRSVRGFDNAFTAPDAGFAGAGAYYRGSSAADALSGIRRPALILSSQDDPFVPVSMFAPHRGASAWLRMMHPGAGGHCGYWAGSAPRFWAAEASLAFLDDALPGG
ncbi:MAG TPA: alpha/beta fold hydrolase [Candidatus Polarisedimenticolaceae bacterium]|nr:alpha/beta fold hydrolase [Candidatus Polarisedimenticolaceae bacterium]